MTNPSPTSEVPGLPHHGECGIVVATENEPVHRRFGLSYASYVVIPRSMLQSMPIDWQQKFVDLLDELDNRLGHHSIDGEYCVTFKDAMGRFATDPLASYERGRRRLEATE